MASAGIEIQLVTASILGPGDARRSRVNLIWILHNSLGAQASFPQMAVGVRLTGAAQPAKIVCEFQSRLSDFWLEIEWLLRSIVSTRNGHEEVH